MFSHLPDVNLLQVLKHALFYQYNLNSLYFAHLTNKLPGIKRDLELDFDLDLYKYRFHHALILYHFSDSLYKSPQVSKLNYNQLSHYLSHPPFDSKIIGCVTSESASSLFAIAFPTESRE